MIKRTVVLLFLVLFSYAPLPRPASAQSNGPVYIVQAGDTLSLIASRFNVSLNDLIAANPSIDPNLLAPGQEVVIPGLNGVSGVLQTEIIQLGDSLRSLTRRTQVSQDQLVKLNRLVSPTELYVGISMIIPTAAEQSQYNTRANLGSSMTLLEMAVLQNSDPWALSRINKLTGTWSAIPGDVFYVPTESESNFSGLPSSFINAGISPLPIVQGGTEIVKLQLEEGATASGSLADYPLHFFVDGNEQAALQGIHALLDTGVYPIKLEANMPDGSKQSFEQMILVTSGNYYSETVYVDPNTIDPAVTEPENQQLISITNLVSGTKYWNGVFTSPAVYPDEFTSFYGTRRTYKGLNSDLTIQGFHSGLDFAGGEGLQIFAPAPGVVVFSGPLTVRGNATVIDHGWGVYSGFWHQSETFVQVGDYVDQGQVIGLVGGTGRVTGAHLHWEVWVNGVQVNPLSWLEKTYP